jgi:hypothetical protein
MVILAAVFAAKGVGTAHATCGGVAASQSTWITNGIVDAIVVRGGNCYIGGSFSRVGPYSGHGAPVDSGANPLSGFSTVNGSVMAVAPDGGGGWYIGGSFTSVGGIGRGGLAHILQNGALDSAWDPHPIYGNVWGYSHSHINAITALAVSGGNIYVAGNFTSIGGQILTGLAVLDATGAAKAWNPGGSIMSNLKYMEGVEALAVSPDGGAVYVGGAYSFTLGGQTFSNLIALDATTGNVNTKWMPNPDGGVAGLAVRPDGGAIYAGGYFQTIGSNGASLPFLAAIGADSSDVARFGVADTSWAPNPDSAVYGLALNASGSRLYVGGDFVTIGSNGASLSYLAAIGTNSGDAATFGAADTGWTPNPDNDVNALALSADENTLYAGGWFQTMGGQGRAYAGAVDTISGTATEWNPCPYSSVSALATGASGGKTVIYIGGTFSGMGGQLRRNLAALDASGQATGWAPDPDSYVYALALSADGKTLYVGGNFQTIGSNGASVQNLAAVGVDPGDSTSFGIADSGWAPNPDSYVRALALSPDGSTLYAGGGFQTIGANGASLPYLAAIGAKASDLKTFGVSNTSWAPNPDCDVDALALSSDGKMIYAGGFFATAGGQIRNNIAALDTSSALATSWDPAIYGSNGSRVAAIALSGNTVYIGGNFNQAGGQSMECLAAVDATTGQGKPWYGSVFSSGNGGGWISVDTLAVLGQTLYVGGHFQGIGGLARNNLAALDGSSGLAYSWDPGTDGEVYSIAVSDSTVYVGGAFNNIDQYGQESFAALAGLGELWANSTDFGGFWRYLSWFGYFSVGDSPWIYHARLGWLYPIGTSQDNLWFWDARMGSYWWTSRTAYPWIYSERYNTWLYYSGSSNPRWFYNVSTGKWVEY